MADTDIVALLNDLIETCKDGEQGFKEAAENVREAQLRVLFLQYADQRAHFVRELADEVRRLGGTPEKTGSVAGTMHRRWIDVKSALTGKDDEAIISECERGEDIAKASYEKAAGASLPGMVASLVRRQFTAVKEAHDRIRDMERAAEMK